ncbi:MAG: tripartite tricarboxylate transporter substrate-binding protein [Desulfatiglandales bacterium]|jgi:tripartite-type tricarboxylate transporter receptor subunit TctC|nr:tripartite tricarboxylate transporter substrate-binding protein [Desulfatiglandales bacterium]
MHPGGGYDLYSMEIAGTLKKYFSKGINVIIMNKPGAGGQVATSYIYNAKPHGYTTEILPMPGLYVSQMFIKTSYDMNKITWLGAVLNEPLVFAVAASSKLKTLQDVC